MEGQKLALKKGVVYDCLVLKYEVKVGLACGDCLWLLSFNYIFAY